MCSSLGLNTQITILMFCLVIFIYVNGFTGDEWPRTAQEALLMFVKGLEKLPRRNVLCINYSSSYSKYLLENSHSCYVRIAKGIGISANLTPLIISKCDWLMAESLYPLQLSLCTTETFQQFRGHHWHKLPIWRGNYPPGEVPSVREKELYHQLVGSVTTCLRA